ncbi:MAG: ferritin-like domain-containing protein [Luteolibacter sp.]
MKLDTLEKLFVHELKDIHSAEKQLLEAIPAMTEAATNDELKAAFNNHLEETKTQLSRLEKIFEGIDFQPGGHKCVAMAGLIEEGEEMCKADANDHVRDAGLIACAQRVEHYEIAAYGTAVALAEKLGHQDVADTLRKTLEEEGKTDRDLSHLAHRIINFEALMAAH